MALHRLEQVDRARDVVVVVQQRLLRRLADGLEPREVDARVDLRDEAEQRLKLLRVAQVELDEVEPRARAVARETRDAYEALRRRVHEVVDDRDLVPRLQQEEHRVRADVARAAGHEHVRLAADVRPEPAQRPAAPASRNRVRDDRRRRDRSARHRRRACHSRRT